MSVRHGIYFRKWLPTTKGDQDWFIKPLLSNHFYIPVYRCIVAKHKGNFARNIGSLVFITRVSFKMDRHRMQFAACLYLRIYCRNPYVYIHIRRTVACENVNKDLKIDEVFYDTKMYIIGLTNDAIIACWCCFDLSIWTILPIYVS